MNHLFSSDCSLVWYWNYLLLHLQDCFDLIRFTFQQDDESFMYILQAFWCQYCCEVVYKVALLHCAVVKLQLLSLFLAYLDLLVSCLICKLMNIQLFFRFFDNLFRAPRTQSQVTLILKPMISVWKLILNKCLSVSKVQMLQTLFFCR